MHITFRLICENFSRVTLNKSFLWGSKYGAYAASSVAASVTSWYLRNDRKNFTFVISYIKFVCMYIAQWLFGGNSDILQNSDVFAHRQKRCKQQSIFKQTRVDFFNEKIWRHLLMMSQLR